MKKLKKILIAALLLITFLGVHATTYAFDLDLGSFFADEEKGLSFTQYEGQLATLDAEGYDPSLTGSSDLKEFILKVVNYGLGFLGLLAVLIVIYGGVLYVTAAGEEENAGKGKKAIMYATIGLLIVMGSFAFVNTIIKSATGTGETTGFTTIVGNTGVGFNSSAEQIRATAIEIYNNFAVLADITEEIQNIRNEASSQPLDSNPSKNEVMSFLLALDSKLEGMKSKLSTFSEAVANINEYQRSLDKVLANIESAGDTEYMAIWQTEKSAIVLSGPTSPLMYIINPVVQSFKVNLEKNIEKIDETYQTVQSFEAISSGKAKDAYDRLKGVNGYGGLSGLLNDWNLSGKPVDNAGQKIAFALEAQAQLYEELKTLQFVQARLTADNIEGNAPMTVIFDAIATTDPAGGSLKGSNIIWDIAGENTLSELQANNSFTGIAEDSKDGNVTCERQQIGGQDKETLIGNTSQRCTFHTPGTYQAAIKIKSNEDGKYAPGISVLTIKVHPPTTKIELNMSAASNVSETIMHYEGELLTADKRTVGVTLKEAAEITFDASKTNAEQYKWTFGNGKSTEFTSNGIATTSYDKVGKYEVVLDVLSPLGVPDRKVFTLEVSGLAARIKANQTQKSYINSPVLFDGSGSRADLGTIKQYTWLIEPAANMTLPSDIADFYPFEQSGSAISKLTHEFKYPLDYDVTLIITDDKGNIASDTIKSFRVESQKPVAQFVIEAKDESQPSTVYFNANSSFDPDGTDEFLKYEWTVAADSNKWSMEKNTALNSKNPYIKFREAGEYEVTLRVIDGLTSPPYEYDEITKTVKITKTLDVAWGENQEVTAVIGDEGQAVISFTIISDNAIAYEIDFGDGDIASGDMSKSKKLEHSYNEGGKFNVRLTVFDEQDNDNTIARRVFISGGDKPVAKIGVLVNGINIYDLIDTIEVHKKDIITFDASESKNTDGTGRKLIYSWDFGDTDKSPNKKTTHYYKDLSPEDAGFYTVKLRVTDSDDSTLTDEDVIKINVVSAPPTFTSIQAVPITGREGDFTTPVRVNMTVLGAEDPDGKIIQYKWWYYDIKDPEEPLGLQITTGPTTQITIGTKGEEGEEITYGFGLEVTDSDNLKTSSNELFAEGEGPTLAVINGPNDMPTAKFSVSVTSIFTGESVAFTSSSTDPDGSIVSYIWDFEGDGFFNNQPTTEKNTTHVYNEKNLNGYSVRLKVADDKGAEAVSVPVKIYVDAFSEDPVADFEYEIISGTSGKKLQFTNKSTADSKSGAKITSYKWDFDTNSALTTVNDDVDSTEENPSRIYTEYGDYTARLTVTDDQGNTDDVVKTVKIIKPATTSPTTDNPITGGLSIGTAPETDTDNSLAATLSSIPASAADGIIYLPGETGAVTFDFSKSKGLIKTYVIDKNIYFDTDGNEVKNDDQDFKTTLPGRWKTNFDKAYGKIVVKLTVIDIYGNESSTLKEIKFQ